jgi:tyrosinase
MIETDAMRKGAGDGTLVADMPFDVGVASFTRADLVFLGVDHAQISYEVWAYLNNPTATAATERTPENGYAGRFIIFGHGGCYGDDGHCLVPSGPPDPFDLRPRHPLTPTDKSINVTRALRRLIEGGHGLTTVTLVTVAVTPRRRDRKPSDDLFHFDGVELRSYLSDVEPDAVEELA